jgi:hypothetical protein
MRQTVKLLGSVAVDSGMLRIGDPCYEIPFDEEVGSKGILEHILPIEDIPTSKAFDFATTWGDGIYDIIGIFENGKLARVVIELDML